MLERLKKCDDIVRTERESHEFRIYPLDDVFKVNIQSQNGIESNTANGAGIDDEYSQWLRSRNISIPSPQFIDLAATALCHALEKGRKFSTMPEVGAAVAEQLELMNVIPVASEVRKFRHLCFVSSIFGPHYGEGIIFNVVEREKIIDKLQERITSMLVRDFPVPLDRIQLARLLALDGKNLTLNQLSMIEGLEKKDMPNISVDDTLPQIGDNNTNADH